MRRLWTDPVARLRARALLGSTLLLFVIAHLALCWPLTGDPRAFVAESAERQQSGVLGALALGVLALLACHVALVALALRASTPTSVTLRGLERVEALASVLTASFVLYHVGHVRVLESGPDVGAFTAYGALLADLGRPLPLAAYIVGVTATCFLTALCALRLVSPEPAGRPVARFAIGALGLFLWALWLQPLAKLATGAALF